MSNIISDISERFFNLGRNRLESVLKQAHPLQIVDMRDSRLTIGINIKYSYVTNKNNKKEGEKIFLFDGNYISDKDIIKSFEYWVEKYNYEHKFRKISNVKFLESSVIGIMSKVD